MMRLLLEYVKILSKTNRAGVVFKVKAVNNMI